MAESILRVTQWRIRRECLDWVIIFSEGHLRRVLNEYFEYYNSYRVHQSLEMDATEGRSVESSEQGNVIAIPTSSDYTITTRGEQLEA